jgi:solute carrier family 35 (GDP-fucose transporter), member C1
MLLTRPSIRILVSCSMITFGFFIGVFLDGTHISRLGVIFGISSSLMTALHAAVMKRGFKVVEGSALSMSWYSNLLSSVLLMPFIIILGEGPAALDLLSGRGEGFWTFIIGSAVSVSTAQPNSRAPFERFDPVLKL